MTAQPDGSLDAPTPRTLAKPQRQHRVARLLADHSVSSQAQLVDLLAAEGVMSTQATVSRDLEDLGAIKVRVGGGETVYAIPELPTEQRAPEDHLRRVFSEWVVEVAHSANLVVLRTPPGSAHVVGWSRKTPVDAAVTVPRPDSRSPCHVAVARRVVIVVSSPRNAGQRHWSRPLATASPRGRT